MPIDVNSPGRLAKAVLLSLSLMLCSGSLAYGQNNPTTTPIKHVVVIFQENVSFDHYFATYPSALNPAGEPRFVARRGTPSVNGLSAGLLTANPNQVNPFRFSRSQAATCDQDHDYGDEQSAFDHGAMDKFVETVGNGPGTDGTLICKRTDVMGFFDGNTVTALWNYAQRFAMSDNSFGTTFGPSTPGALNLVAGSTATATPANLGFSRADSSRQRSWLERPSAAQPTQDLTVCPRVTTSRTTNRSNILPRPRTSTTFVPARWQISARATARITSTTPLIFLTRWMPAIFRKSSS